MSKSCPMIFLAVLVILKWLLISLVCTIWLILLLITKKALKARVLSLITPMPGKPAAAGRAFRANFKYPEMPCLFFYTLRQKKNLLLALFLPRQIVLKL